MQRHSSGTSGEIFCFIFSSSAFLARVNSLQTFFWEKALTEYLRGFLLKDSWSSVKCLLFCQFSIRDKLYFSVIFAFHPINTEFFHASWVFFVIY